MQIQAINTLNSISNFQKVANNFSNINFNGRVSSDCFCPSCSKGQQYVAFVKVPVAALPEAEYAKTLENNFDSSCDKDSSENQYIAVTKFIA